MKHSRRPICVHRSAARRARQGALHNRRGAGLQECVRAAAYAVCRRRFAARRRGFAERKDVFAVCRDFRGFRKVVLRALAPARPVRRAPFPIRSATDTGFRRPGGERTAVRTGRSASVLACAGGACGYAVIGCATPTAGAAYAGCCFGAQARERCVRRASRCGIIAKKDSLLVPGGGFLPPAAAPLLRSLWAASFIGRKARLRPESPLGCRCGKPAKRDFPPVRGPLRDGCGRLTEVYGIRAPAADMVCGAL